jgi:diadenosine tetraphosphate (Ap4A) HIT family hydrolase
MPTVFSMIIAGDLPAHFVYRDDVCVAFMSIEPIRTGHTLVVPIEEVDHWIDLDEATLSHLVQVSQRIAGAIAVAYPSEKVGMMVAGLEVPHVHVHLIPIDSPSDLDFSRATPADASELAIAAERIRDSMTL